MYSPKIRPELVRKLYKLKHSTGKKRPMTHIVNEAVEKYLKDEEAKSKNNNFS